MGKPVTWPICALISPPTIRHVLCGGMDLTAKIMSSLMTFMGGYFMMNSCVCVIDILAKFL